MVHHTRRWILLVTILFMAFTPACSASPTPSPTQEDSFEPVVSAEAVSVKILIPNSIPSQIRYDDIMKRLNELLKSKGQHAEFELRAVSYDNSGTSSFLTKAKEELAAGNPPADAYALNFDESQSLFESSLTMDMTGLVRQYAPVYFSKYGGMFGDTLSGVPVGIYAKPVLFQSALVLRKDYLDQASAVSTTESLFAFLDSAVVTPKKRCCVLSDPGSLVGQWALEQGYYSLGMFGVDGYLYAAVKDPQCKPVALESIPGLDAFLAKLMTYYKNDSLDGNFYTIYSTEPIGFVKNLSDYYVSNPFSWMSWIPGEFTAQVFSPELPSLYSDPVYVEELAVPASCAQAKAAEIVRFVEWCNASQENYDTVLYGEAGTDFSASGARFAPMKEGKPQDMKAITQMQGLFFTWPGASVLSNTEYFRLSVSAPVNIEKLYDAGQKSGQRFEANEFLKTDRKTMEAMRKLGPGMADIARMRDDALNNLIYGTPAAYSNDTYAQCSDALSKLRTDSLIADYQRLLGELMDEK